MKLLEINKSIKLLKFIQIKKTYKHFDTSHLVCVRRVYLCTPLSTLFNSWAPIRLLPYFPRECRVYAGLADSGRFKRRFFLPATGHHHHSRLFLLRESRALKSEIMLPCPQSPQIRLGSLEAHSPQGESPSGPSALRSIASGCS